MADISKIKLPDNVEYNLKDATARENFNNYVPTSQVGIAGGVASLDSTGKVPTSQLPATTSERTIASTFWGTCDTGSNTAEKAVVCPEYDRLVVGDTIHVNFRYRNTVNSGNLTLNVNNTGAKSIKQYRGGSPVNLADYTVIIAGELDFIYNGTYWVQSFPSKIYAKSIDSTDYNRRSLFVADGLGGYDDAPFIKTPYISSSSVYVYNDKLYSGNSEVVTVGNLQNQVIDKIEYLDHVVDIRHDQYLANCEEPDSSTMNYAVLRLYLVTEDGHIFMKSQGDEDRDLLTNNDFYVDIMGYNSSNEQVSTYINHERLNWQPCSWQSYSSHIYQTPYWMEFGFEFDDQVEGIDHITVSIYGTGIQSNNPLLSLYNSNQSMDFEIRSSAERNTVEIKNVGLVFSGGFLDYNGGYLVTNIKLPPETVNVSQSFVPNSDGDHFLVRGYAFKRHTDYIDPPSWDYLDPNGLGYNQTELENTILLYNDQFYYTNGYFLIPLAEEDEQEIVVEDTIAAASTSMNVPTVHSVASFVEGKGYLNSNQGAANAGKFLVVNSSGVVEPVSMTAWQGGSY